ncbi:MAG: phosphoribosyltransferase family protein [bacterium]
MMFEDRIDAGQQLAKALEKYRDDDNAIVLALPRGGVVVGGEVARELGLPLDIIVPRKIGAEFNPEYAIGAITETGEVVWNEDERKGTSPEYIDKVVADEKTEAERRLEKYRGDKKPRDLKGKTVILVDDGIATGLTMTAAIKTAQAEGPSKVVVAVPHGAKDSLDTIRKMVNEVVALDEPEWYTAVGAFYKEFGQTEDQEVVNILHEVDSRR